MPVMLMLLSLLTIMSIFIVLFEEITLVSPHSLSYSVNLRFVYRTPEIEKAYVHQFIVYMSVHPSTFPLRSMGREAPRYPPGVTGAPHACADTPGSVPDLVCGTSR